MKKNAKRLLGLLIVLAMMVSLVGTMALADSTAAAKEPVVTYIGTSVSSGFFLDQNENDWTEEDWAAIVADGKNDFGKKDYTNSVCGQTDRSVPVFRKGKGADHGTKRDIFEYAHGEHFDRQ